MEREAITSNGYRWTISDDAETEGEFVLAKPSSYDGEPNWWVNTKHIVAFQYFD